jgi:hypothetical protein
MPSTTGLDLVTDTTDSEIILLIMKGKKSSYSVWAYMTKESKEGRRTKKVMTYRNINKRVIRLAKLGLIQEIKVDDPHSVNIHGRKDYKITLKGLECIIPQMIAYPEDIKTIIEYMDKFRVDKRSIGPVLAEKAASAFQSINQLSRFMDSPEIKEMYARKHMMEMKPLQDEVNKLRKEVEELHRVISPVSLVRKRK